MVELRAEMCSMVLSLYSNLNMNYIAEAIIVASILGLVTSSVVPSVVNADTEQNIPPKTESNDDTLIFSHVVC